MMSGWRDTVPTSGTVHLPPDPRVLDGLGRNHSLETALADLVDNAIDANASHVLIRLVRRGGKPRAVYVADNGHGMSPDTIDTAMTVGGRREYNVRDLGHFGLGLKAASFSQARVLTVMSKAAGDAAVGRRWALNEARRGFLVDVVPEDFAEDEFARGWSIPWPGTGTVIRWDIVTGFPATDDASRIETFITRTIQSVSNHLGLVFHRILHDRRVIVVLDVEDVDDGDPGFNFTVTPLDPFGYRRSGRGGYPKELVARSDEATIRFRCHIWPGRSNLAEFKLMGGPERHQGLYIYRRDRLLQAGGDWGGITALGKRLQLARVEVEVDDDTLKLFRMNAEKSRVIVDSEVTQLAENAVSEDTTTFASYLEEAENVFRESRKRRRERRKMSPPGKGFARRLRKTIGQEVPLLEDAPVDLRWKRFDAENDDFFELDRTQRTLWLNERYRAVVLGGRRGGLNDAPLVKALLYLLMEETFQGEWLGSKDKDNLELWQEILTTAVNCERQ
jgi:hypothetical protein